MKKRNLLKALVALAVLSSMLLSTLLGVSTALITKTLSKKIDFESIPDLDLAYYIYDADATDTDDYSGSEGIYKNAHSFSQEIVVGTKDQTTETFRNSNNVRVKLYTGESIVYQIKIPVDESGYYTLAFTPEFIKADADGNYVRGMRDGTDKYIEQDYYTISYRFAVGCEVLNDEDNVAYASSDSILNLEENVFGDNLYYQKQNYLAESAFQWKTLCISRAEDVKLSFKATDDDVTNGYVIWSWELDGLRGENKYLLECTSVSVKKTMELDGSTKYRVTDSTKSGSEPYFMLPQTLVTNNQVKIYGIADNLANVDDNGTGNSQRRGSNTPGKSDYSGGRGTYVTEATANSLGLRAETLNSGANINATGGVDGTWKHDNPLSIQIPLKNIKYNTTYKVTFDFSVARQGYAAPVKGDTSNYTQDASATLTRYYNGTTKKTGSVGANMWDYTDFSYIFNPVDVTGLSGQAMYEKDLEGRNFFSYLSSITNGIANDDEPEKAEYPSGSGTYFNVSRLSSEDHLDALDQINYNHKADQGQPLTRYNNVVSLHVFNNDNSKRNYPDLTTVKSVNDTYSIDYFNSSFDEQYPNSNAGTIGSTMMRNWYNAVQHTEMNGQVAINWITFYNTTFSFNIPEGQTGVNLEELYWVWAIDALHYECFYNIRIDNLRIEEVVQYASSLTNSSKSNPSGIKIANTQVGIDHMNSYGEDTEKELGMDTGLFNNFKGWNGTGQNYITRGYNRTTYTTTGNVFAPIVDAKEVAATPGGGIGATDYKIYLSGFAVCKGGIDKYVWSADGGITWYDMTLTGKKATSAQLRDAEKGVDQRTQAQSNRFLEPCEKTEEHVATHEPDKDGNIPATCDRCVNYPNLPGETREYVDFVTFTAEDGLNSNFAATTTSAAGGVKYYLEADISPYKGQCDLDIIIAAVPAANPNLRCEMVKIINYNSANTYVSKVEAIKSDITSSGVSENGVLSIPKEKLSVTNGACGTSDIYNKGKYYANHYPVNETGVMYNYNSRTTTENAESTTINYRTLKATYSDIPVKTMLQVVGEVVCYNGVYEYAYSVDGGETWATINNRQAIYHIMVNGSPLVDSVLVDSSGNKTISVTLYKDSAGTYRYSKDFKYVEADGKTYECRQGDEYLGNVANVAYNSKFNLEYTKGNTTGSTFTKYETLLYKWLTRNTSLDGHYFENANGDFFESGTRIYVDLSAYAGQVVDVIVAVKPNFQGDKTVKTDVYLPVAKVDNVAVYGENGTFYTSINNVILDRVNDSGKYTYAQTLTPTMTHLNGDYFTGKSKSEWSSVVPTTDWAYTMLEPQNVDVRNTRFYNNTVNEMLSGGKVTIDGYIVCKGGVNRYKYSLDGGETWTIIEDIGTAVPADSGDVKLFGNALYADAGFTLANDGVNGNFSSSAVPSEADATSHLLEFDLPALTDDEDDKVVKNLLVVAESNDKDNKPSGQLFPVLHIRLKFKYASTNGVKNTTQYGYYRSVNNGASKAAGYIQNTEVWTLTPTGETNDAFNRLTIPVSEAGTYTLSFKPGLSNDGNATKKTLYCTVSSDSESGNTRFSDVKSVINYNDATYKWKGTFNKATLYAKREITNIVVTEEDAKRGYIIWDWDLRSLDVGKTYEFTLTEIKLTKNS